MTTARILQDTYGRSQACLIRVLDHLADQDPALLDRELAGFPYPTLRGQLHHLIGGERYWVGVLEGEVRIDVELEHCPDLATLRTFHQQVTGVTTAFLLSGDDLDTVRTITTWRGEPMALVPRHALLRAITHAHHHLGQVHAMLRMLEAPLGGLDFPLAP